MTSQVYTIPSATTPGTEYTVTVHPDGVLSCDCPDATYRRRQCKHQRQVVLGAIPMPVPTPAERPLEPGFRRVGRDIIMDAGFNFPVEA